MTVHCNRFLVNKTNSCTEFQFYWYYDCTCFGQPFCPSSEVLSRCTAKNSWWWAERLPETCRVVIPIKLEFSASVGFIQMKFKKSSRFISGFRVLWNLAVALSHTTMTQRFAVMKSFQHVALWWHVWWMKPTLPTITSPPPLQIRFVGRQICTSYSVEERSNFTFQSAPTKYCVNTDATVPYGNDILHTYILWILKCVTERRMWDKLKNTKYSAFLQCKALWTFHKTVQEDCLTLKDGTYRLFRNVGNYESTLRNIPEERSSHTVVEAW